MRRLRVLWGALLVSAVAGGTLLLANRHQAEGASPAALHVPDRRCRGGCLSPLLRVLPGGPLASQVGTGALQDTWGRTVTDTRASSKTCCTNASCSTLVTLGNNQPCVDTVGLNVEGSATNLVLYSGDLTNAAWTKRGTASVTTSGTGPDGTTAAQQLTVATVSNDVYQSVSVATGAAYTPSAWIWPVTTSGLVYFLNPSNQANGQMSFDLSSLPTGKWTRVTPSSAGVTVTSPFTGSSVGGGGIQFVGSGAGVTFKVSSVQVETGSFATSYIATTGTTATRAADAISYPTVALTNAQGAVKACITPGWPTGSTPSGTNAQFLTGPGGGAPLLAYVNQTDGALDTYDGTTAVTVQSNWTQNVKRCYRNTWTAGNRTVYNLTDNLSGTTAAGWLGAFSSPSLISASTGLSCWLTDVCVSAQPSGCP